MKGSGYETGLGKARSGREMGPGTQGGAQPAGQAWRGKEELHVGPGFSHLWNQLQGKGRVPGLRRELPDDEGI